MDLLVAVNEGVVIVEGEKLVVLWSNRIWFRALTLHFHGYGVLAVTDEVLPLSLCLLAFEFSVRDGIYI